MKQIQQSEKIKGYLRAAFGPDANLDNLAVYECVALTTLPLRKSGGIFEGARPTLSLLTELAASVNAESVPLQLVHDNTVIPFGRFFYGTVVNDELRGYFAVDKTNHPDIVAKLDSGVLDQVSVGFAPKQIKCSGCGYDFLDPSNLMGLWTLTCDQEHVLGQDGIFAWVDGLKQFFELSLVGKGASKGARVVGPSDAQLSHNEQFKLAASANPGLFCVSLSPTVKDLPEMTPEQMATFSAAVEGKATALAELATTKTQLTAAQEQVTQLTAQVAELQTKVTTAEQTAADATKHQEGHEKAVAALTAEAKTVLTALKKPTDNLPTDVDALLAIITENRAAFAAIVPAGGASTGADADTNKEAPRNVAAFRAPQ